MVVGLVGGHRAPGPVVCYLVVSTADIDGDLRVVDGLHYVDPGRQLCLELFGAEPACAVDEVAEEEEEIDVSVRGLGGELCEGDPVYTVVVAAAVGGYDELPLRLCGSQGGEGREQEGCEEKLYCEILSAMRPGV